MEVYLPIAGMSVNALLILVLGVATGVLSGMFGVGGGFLMTPFLIFIGIPPSVAVASSANQIVASSVSGFLAHWKRQNVDLKMGIALLVGGMFGSSLGILLFRLLQKLGQIDLVISIFYVFFLGSIGVLMAVESVKNYLRQRGKLPPRKEKTGTHPFIERLPLKTAFPRSKIEISLLMPLGIGFLVGIMVSIMGVGGGFFLIPAMIYLLRMPTSVVVGTSLFQIIFITANVTLLQAITAHTVDVVLAFLLLAGSVIGAQFGTRYASRLPAEKLQAMLALLVLGVSLRLAYGLFAVPGEIYSVTIGDL